MHNIFYIALLELQTLREGKAARYLEELLLELKDELEEQEVEDIVAYDKVFRLRRYLVKQKGQLVKYNTQEPKEHIGNASKIVVKYNREVKKTYKKQDNK